MSIIKNMKVSCMLLLISEVLISTSPCTVMAKGNDVQEKNVKVEKIVKSGGTQWIYKTENGKLYMRLKDLTTGKWLTDWILVG